MGPSTAQFDRPGHGGSRGAGPKAAPEAGLAKLGQALALALPGPLVLLFESADPVSLLAWLAVLAPATGCFAGARGLALWPFGLTVPGIWAVALVLADGRGRVHVSTPFYAILALAGLFALGVALGKACGAVGGRSPMAAAGVTLLLGALAAGLAGRGGAAGAPLPVAAARALLDASPVSLVVESAGMDWMRDPAVYDPAATDRFQRTPYRGELAGPLALLVGCLSAALAHALFRGSRARDDLAASDPRT